MIWARKFEDPRRMVWRKSKLRPGECEAEKPELVVYLVGARLMACARAVSPCFFSASMIERETLCTWESARNMGTF